MRLPLTNQVIRFIPSRKPLGVGGLVPVVDLRIINKSKRKEVYFVEQLIVNKVNHFYEIQAFATLKESETYIIEITNLGDLIYRGLFFATDKNIPFSINEDKFKEHPTNNEYIILYNE